MINDSYSSLWRFFLFSISSAGPLELSFSGLQRQKCSFRCKWLGIIRVLNAQWIWIPNLFHSSPDSYVRSTAFCFLGTFVGLVESQFIILLKENFFLGLSEVPETELSQNVFVSASAFIVRKATFNALKGKSIELSDSTTASHVDSASRCVSFCLPSQPGVKRKKK